MCLALRASGLWLRYAALQSLIPSFPWIAPPALHPGAIQGKEGIKFCYLATLLTESSLSSPPPLQSNRGLGGREDGKRAVSYSATHFERQILTPSQVLDFGQGRNITSTTF